MYERPRTRAELSELLAAHSIPVSLAKQAKWGLELVPADDGDSQLGGRPQLVGGWPLSKEGRAQTHLASIALGELPNFEDRALLPTRGTLVFFAFVDDAGDDEAHVMHVLPDAGRAVSPPLEPLKDRVVPVELNERRVRFEPVLTVPFPRNLEYEQATALSELSYELGTPKHLLLGHPVYVQDNPPEDGQISLLQLNWDEPLGLRFGDGGQITLHGMPEDIRAGRWERITAQTDDS